MPYIICKGLDMRYFCIHKNTYLKKEGMCADDTFETDDCFISADGRWICM